MRPSTHNPLLPPDTKQPALQIMPPEIYTTMQSIPEDNQRIIIGWSPNKDEDGGDCARRWGFEISLKETRGRDASSGPESVSYLKKFFKKIKIF